MPFADLSDVRIHYSLTGPESAPVLVLCNSLGSNFSMWDPQLPDFSKYFRLLRYDTRGHGQSSAPPGPYTIELLASDVLYLLDALHLDRVNFCGLSMGGQIGMWLGIHAANRLYKVVLCNTGAKIGTADSWNTRIDTVLKNGMKEVAPLIASRWFTPEHQSAHPEIFAYAVKMIRSSNPQGYAACCAALREFDASNRLSAISVPTLVVAGSNDPATPPVDGRYIADQIPGARFLELPAAHLSNIEAAAAFSSAVLNFLSA
ncbi:MAG: 3-oxoadipate enol-lactonase [Acidobacteria bacterium]|nr:3-oxoadipate enol-lactonase [Acidobacteriota bacterium]MBS1865960.1 3-oxoadipate enol-lactonase [Acidobacteriota bacterium]